MVDFLYTSSSVNTKMLPPPQARDIAPLRLVSWVSCEVPDHVQHVLHQLMALFGEVAPVSSEEVIAIGVQQLGVTAKGEISWGHGQGTH